MKNRVAWGICLGGSVGYVVLGGKWALAHLPTNGKSYAWFWQCLGQHILCAIRCIFEVRFPNSEMQHAIRSAG
jgi:hypothetical protein